MNADRIITVGTEPFASAALGTYYVQDGQTFAKASEIEGKYDVHCKVFVQIGIPANLRDTGDKVRDAACEHSFTRKLQEVLAGAYRKEGVDLEAVANAYPETYTKLILHEKKERAEKIRLDDTTKEALRKVAGKLAKDAGHPMEGKKFVPSLTKDEVKTFMAAAREEMASNSKLWQKALALVSQEL